MQASNNNIFTRTQLGAGLRLVIILSLQLFLLAACSRDRTDGHGGILTLAGSTSVQPFAEKLAEQYMAGHKHQTVNVQGGGSTAGVRAAQSGAAQIGMSSRDLKTDEKDLHETVIAHDGIAIIVHTSNPLVDLSLDRISRIFAGEITRWEDLGAGRGDIHFVTREEGSGTRSAFEEKVMGTRSIAPRALVQDSNGAVREIVANDPRALGYISLGLVDRRVKALAVDGVHPSRETILAKKYSVVRPFLFLTKTEPKGPAKRFIDYILSAEGQRLLGAEGLIPVKE
jgi:phosphate transport system substrate-binding protein